MLIFIVTLLSGVFGLLQPWPMKILIDNVLGKRPLSGTLAHIATFFPGASTRGGLLTWVVLATLVFFAANSLTDVILTRAWIRVSRGMVYELGSDIFAHLQRRSLLFHSRNSVGDSISRITGDSWCVFTVVETLLFAPLHSFITLVGVLIVMVHMDLTLTLVSIGLTPFAGGLTVLFARRVRATIKRQREIQSNIQSHVQRTFTGISIVQAFTREDREHRRFQEFAADSIRAQQSNVFVGSFARLCVGLVSSLGAALVLWIAARHVMEGRLTIGSLLVFLAYLAILRGQLKTFTGMYGVLQGVGVGVDRVMGVLEGDLEVQDRAGAIALPPVQGHVRIEHAVFGYEQEQPVLRDICIEALPGETVAIVGATGVGKSTLVSLIPRFFDPWSGRVTIDGYDVRDVQVKSVREQVALVLQEPFLFPVSIADNIAYGRPDAGRDEIEAAARAANAHAFIDRLPAGYDTMVGERGATLSGGERQRLSIARALLKDAPILILDEPTSALDAETESLLLEALERLMQGRTTFIIAHRLSTIRRADRIVVLQDGTVVETETHANLLASNGVYARLHRIQLGERASATTSGVG